MSTEFNSAQNKNRREEAGNDSELNIQDLLEKYLPEYADEEPLKKETAETEEYEEVPAEDADEEAFEEVEEKKSFSNLFARLRRQVEEEDDDIIAPDSSIFDEISEEMTDEAEEESPEESEETADTAEDKNLFFEWQAETLSRANEDAEEEAEEEELPQELEEFEEKFEESAEAEAEEEEALEDAIDDTDINLMVALGLEEQLDDRMGAGTADEAAARMDAAQREFETQQRRQQEFEYTDRSQTPQIAAAYKFSLGSLKIKMIAAAILTALLFFYENIAIFGVQFAGALDPAVYPVVYIMMSLQLLLLTLAAAYEQIFTGFTNLFTLRPTPESALSVLSVISVLYSVGLAFTAEVGIEPVLYNFPVALAAFMTLLYAYFNTKREVFSFNVISSKRPKYVFNRIAPSEGVSESRAFGATDEESPDVLRITSTEFVDGYFDRTGAVLHTTRVYVGAILSAVAAAAVLIAVFARIGGSTGKDAITAAYLAFVAGVPLSMFFTYSYPFYKANREAYDCDSTIVGECSLDEYAGASIVSFDDKNVFPSYSVKVQNIKIYNNNRIDRVLYYAASSFSAAGGPLADVFELATVEMGRSEDVEIHAAEAGYLETVVDGRRILFGRSDILTELGYDIPLETVEEDSYVQGDLSILYMLRDGDLIAKMYVRYVMDPDFEFILRQFARGGTCVCVKTLDPNIDEEMIFSKVRGKKYPLKIVRNTENEETVERMNSGIVTRGTTKSLLQVVSYCDMVLSVKNTNLVVSIVSAVVSLAILVIVTMSRNLGALSSWMVAVNHLFWMIPAMLTAKLFIK